MEINSAMEALAETKIDHSKQGLAWRKNQDNKIVEVLEMLNFNIH